MGSSFFKFCNAIHHWILSLSWSVDKLNNL
jgi:hypothetical protein